MACATLGKVCGKDTKLNVKGPGYDAFEEAREIRNRITHPTSAERLKISQGEMEIVENAGKWFVENVVTVTRMTIPQIIEHAMAAKMVTDQPE